MKISWKIVGASVQGTRHQHEGRVCEDAHGSLLLEDVPGIGPLLLLVAADGAGFAPHAADGAICAVRVTLERAAAELARSFSDEEQLRAALLSVLKTARMGLELFAALGNTVGDEEELEQQEERGAVEEDDSPFEEQEGEYGGEDSAETTGSAGTNGARPLREFATTLILVACAPAWVAALQVGDGAAVLQLEGAALEALTSPDHGEYINETSFLTGDDYLERAQFAVRFHRDEVQAVALLTDGLQQLCLLQEQNAPYAPFFGPVFEFARSQQASQEVLAAYLGGERVSEHTDDDKTLVLAVRDRAEGNTA